MVIRTREMTLDEFLALPETEPATEFIDGFPCQKPWVRIGMRGRQAGCSGVWSSIWQLEAGSLSPSLASASLKRLAAISASRTFPTTSRQRPRPRGGLPRAIS